MNIKWTNTSIGCQCEPTRAQPSYFEDPNECANHAAHDGRSAFLVRGEFNLAKGIRLALEVWVMSNHSLSDTIEHMPCHTKTATKFIRLEERGVRKVIGIE